MTEEIEEIDPRYPKWKYHEAKAGLIVKSEAEEIALGDEWVDRPVPKVEPKDQGEEIKALKAELKIGLEKNAKLFKEVEDLKAKLAQKKPENVQKPAKKAQKKAKKSA